MPEPEEEQEKLHPSAERMVRQVGEKQKRLERSQGREYNVLNAIGMLGVVGWSVAVPTLLGILAGMWLDRHWPSRISWTLTLLGAGLAIGCVSAWLRIEREQK
ncbi:MAG TPA: AtpZ/AtpI family protein [Bryobacteraceae bacterium]|nr:AtpZ/AtpI family protein [Bryobacteraceae bacterium]